MEGLVRLIFKEIEMSGTHINDVEKQRKYDRLHHMKRREWLHGDNPKWACGESVLPSERHQLLAQSFRCIEHKELAFNSVDIHDLEYIAELDAYAQTLSPNVPHEG